MTEILPHILYCVLHLLFGLAYVRLFDVVTGLTGTQKIVVLATWPLFLGCAVLELLCNGILRLAK